MPIETTRLILRDLVQSDALRCSRGSGPTQPAVDELWPMVLKESGELIGHCGPLKKAVDGQMELELVYVLAQAARGKGLATEAALAPRDHAFGALGRRRPPCPRPAPPSSGCSCAGSPGGACAARACPAAARR